MERKEPFCVFAGFDGYIDTLVKPVHTFQADGQADFFKSISEFGTYLTGQAGKSCSLEMQKVVEKVGGNAPIYASAMSALDVHVKCVGAFGYPGIQEVFRDIGENVELFSISNPGKCTALEFHDGKVMLADNDGINEIDYELLVRRLGEEKLYQMIEAADMISLMNWSEVPGCTKIWQGILERIFPKLPETGKKKMFIDISDCTRRAPEEIQKMLDLMREFSAYCEVTLSLNKNEFELVCKVLGLKSSADEMEKSGERLREICKLERLVVHLLDGAYAFTGEKSAFAPNRYVEKPMISTGGGDNFNAGLSCGLLLGLDIRSAMLMANAVSGYYVTYGKSPSLAQVQDYLREWNINEDHI